MNPSHAIKVTKDFPFTNVIKTVALQQQSTRVAGWEPWNRSQMDTIFERNTITPGILSIITIAHQRRLRGKPDGVEGDIPSYSNAYACLLQGCIDTKALPEGKRVHAHMIKIGFKPSIFLWNRLVDLYCKCGTVDHARQVFDRMPAWNVFSWNALISAYANGNCIDDARGIFEKMPERDRVSWNSMVAAYAQHGYGKEALKLFSQMQVSEVKSDEFTFVVVLSACTSSTALERGKQVHTHILKTGIESNSFLGNALIDMYAKCGTMREACQVFDKMPDRDGISMNAMIGGYAFHGHGKEALNVYSQMRQEGIESTKVTFVSIVRACSRLSALEQGKQIHANIVKTAFECNIFVGNALVDMYAKCESTEYAHRLFDKMSERDVVSWNAMIAGYTWCGQGEAALKHYLQMIRACVKPNRCSFASVLGACASIAALDQGKQIHAVIIKSGFESNVFTGSGLVDMYAKCGSIEDACHVFDKMPNRDAVLWTAMIVAYAHHGLGMESLHCFELMIEAGIPPDNITFIGVLSACSYAGLIDEGRYYFLSMDRDHGISPSMDHYACMVDLLGRAGCLNEAEDFLNSMPFKPNSSMWGTLLGACRNHANIEIGKRAAECLLDLEPQSAAPYVVMSNIYAAIGRWDDVANVRKMMKDAGVKKEAGFSWIHVKNRVHLFVVEDRSHPQTEDIYATLEKLAGQMEEAGYVPDMNFILHDVG